jgi:TonB family protein
MCEGRDGKLLRHNQYISCMIISVRYSFFFAISFCLASIFTFDTARSQKLATSVTSVKLIRIWAPKPSAAKSSGVSQTPGDSLYYFEADSKPVYRTDDKTGLIFLNQQFDLTRLSDEVPNGIQLVVKYIVEKDGSMHFAQISELDNSCNAFLATQITNALSKLRFHTPARFQSRPVRLVNAVLFNFNPSAPKQKLSLSWHNPYIDYPKQVTPIVSDVTKQAPISEDVFTYVEEMPRLKGGEAALLSLFQQNIKYPESRKGSGEKANVIASIIVEEDGSISNPRIEKSHAPDFDAEALRVIKLVRFESPGRNNSRLVRVRYSIPVMFSDPGR